MKNKFMNSLFLLFIIALPFSWANIGFMSIYRVITLIGFGFWIFYNKFLIPIPNGHRQVLFKTWLAYAGYAIISIVLYPQNTSVVFGMVLLVMISLIFFSSEYDIALQNKTDYMWIVAGLFFVVLFIVGKSSQVGYGTRQTLVILGTKTDANEFASFFVVSLSVALYSILNDKSIIKKSLCVILLFSGLYVVLMSGSRGALLSAIVGMLITAFLVKKPSFKLLFFLFLISIALIFIVPRYILPLIPESTLSRISIDALKNDNGSGRSDIWIAALDAFVHGNPLHWLFGYGYWGLNVTTWTGTTGTMHNQYLQQLIAYGILGLILYVKLLYCVYCEIKINCKRYLGPFIGLLIMGLTISMGPSYKILWILIFLSGIDNEEGVKNNYGIDINDCRH